jgi:hypothetical protein
MPIIEYPKPISAAEIQTSLEKHLNRNNFPGATIPMKSTDPINPDHYKLNPQGIEAIDAIEASMSPTEFQGAMKKDVMKYIWRYRYKGKPLEDLKKAKWYLERLIASVEEYGVKYE